MNTRLGAEEREGRLFGRFDVLAELGRGGYGRVLRCFDRETGQVVALKRLERITPRAIDAFKREFRIVLDIRHPNIVRLDELLEMDGAWFIVQELVEGVDFHSYVTREETSIPADVERLGASLAQLLDALRELHAHGVVHRDIKPENVRVTPEGRVVLLDFGIAVEPSTMDASTDFEGLGTPAYMAPEQVDGIATSEADLYCVGVMLFEALTGRLPFDGTNAELMSKKRAGLTPAPSYFVDGIPPLYEDLCTALLSQLPSLRPTAAHALEYLSAGKARESSPALGASPARELFVGREPELAMLTDSYKTAVFRQPHAVVIEGESGIGKTALLAEFLRRAACFEPRPMIARGRCHAAEQLRYKAFDAAAEALAKKLARRSEAVQLSRDDTALVLMLFPALATALRVRSVPTRIHQLERAIMFRAFARLLERASDDEPLILAIDDLHWSDEDSLELLQSLLTDARLTNVLFVFTLRPERDYDPRLVGRLRRLLSLPSMRRISLSGLSSEECQELCLASDAEGKVHRLPAKLSQSTGGHPYFLIELLEQGAGDQGDVISLDDALNRRCAALSPLERSLLQTLAVADAPVRTRVLLHTHTADAESVNRAVRKLRDVRLARVARPGTLSVYHDRQRTVLLAGLSPDDVAARHLALALAHEREPDPDPAQVAFHFVAGGSSERARPWLSHALHAAREHGAFAQAIDHANLLLSLTSDPFDARELLAVRAELYGFLGRGREAAEQYLAAMEGADRESSAMLCIRAAEQLLRNGEPQEGLAAAKRAFALLGLPWSSGMLGMVLRMLWARVRLSLSKDSENAPDKVRGEDSARLEALLALSQPLAWLDWVRGAEVTMRLMDLAHRVAHPRYLAYALHAQAIVSSMEQRKPADIEQLIARAKGYVDRENTPDVRAHQDLTLGLSRFAAGEFPDALSCFAAAEARYRRECPREGWQLANARGFRLQVAYWLGLHREHSEECSAFISEALTRGDQFAATNYAVTGLGFMRHLMRDQPDAALEELLGHVRTWESSPTFGGQHFSVRLAGHYIHAYAHPDQVRDFWQHPRQQQGNGLVFRLPMFRDLNYALVALALLARRVQEPENVGAQRELKVHLTKLGAPRSAMGRAFFPYVRAQEALLDAAPAEHVKMLLGQSMQGLTVLNHYWRDFAELLLAHLQGADTFAEREQRVIAWHRDQGWLAPARAMQMCLPIYPLLSRAHGSAFLGG
jgi:hypothetical protein